MDKKTTILGVDPKTILAIVLTAMVIVGVPMLFPSAPPKKPAIVNSADSLHRDTLGAAPAPVTSPSLAAAGAARGVADTTQPATATVPADTARIATPRATWRFTSQGASIASVEATGYTSLRKEDKGHPVELVPQGDLLVHYRLTNGRDTLALSGVPFTATHSADPASPGVSYQAQTALGALTLAYVVQSDSASSGLVHVGVKLDGATAGTQLLVDLPRRIRSEEADSVDDTRHLAYAYKPLHDDAQSVAFTKLDSLRTRVDSGPFRWVAVRNKYFLLAVIGERDSAFTALRMRGTPKRAGLVHEAIATAVLPLRDGAASFELYAGPQQFQRLIALGRGLDNVNPYSSFMRPVVQPFATIVMRLLLWMKASTGLSYGWVLIIFGILIRIAMWPLQQSAMRSSMKMQTLQPELQEVQKKYKDDPEKQREAMMKLYQAHGMSPFSPVIGCLPMLLPMPILFALYYVFGNTIEFRGVPFLWLADLSLKDPFYIAPVLTGVTMFAASWIGMRNAPPNPQAKTMAYMMPAMLTALFLNFASGLNLYYAVQNIASLPQQWLLARERGKKPQGVGK
ncbi:MAG: hypothetical protein JWO05_1854 [Gemmatimonadetes bacterium]|nr:hypothetical protein [Gemmatimonadota bacterium]